jgi:hypothetical protein
MRSKQYFFSNGACRTETIVQSSENEIVRKIKASYFQKGRGLLKKNK